MHYYREIYDVEGLKIVYVTFSDYKLLHNFDDLLELWLHMYDSHRYFRFIFDTRNLINIPSLYYAFRMAFFISRLKKRPTQYLERSLILVNHQKISRLLDFIFSIQSPVAPVYIYHCERAPLKKDMIDMIIQQNITGEDIKEILP